MLEDSKQHIQPFHRAFKPVKPTPLSLEGLDALLNISIFNKRLEKPYVLLKKSNAKGGIMAEISHMLLLPFLKPQIKEKQDAFILGATLFHYIKKIAKQYSESSFRISCLTATDCDMLLNETHQESKTLKENLKQSNLIIWPVGYKAHVHLIAFHLTDSRSIAVSILDSTNNTLLNSYLISKATPIAQRLKGRFATIHYRHYDIPRQSTAYDCAAAVAYYSKALCLRLDMTLFEAVKVPVRYTDFRLEMASMCLDFDTTTFDQYQYINFFVS